MSDLRPELAKALDDLYPGSRHETLRGDASTRRFHRLILRGGDTRVVMDYGAPFEGETDDIRLERVFARAGLPVARLIDILPGAGALVQEDLGDETLESALLRGRPARSELYSSAVMLAADIATKGSEALALSERAGGPALDRERFRFEMHFFVEHYVGGLLGCSDAGGGLLPLLDALADEVASHPRVLCHRDYHSRNVMVRTSGDLAMVDIQDARWGPDTYDIASLLRDAYVDLDEDDVNRLFDDYSRLVAVAVEPQALRSRFDLASTQRMLKALGTFGYQIAVLGRERYRDAIPRTIERLRRVVLRHTQTIRLGDELHRTGLLRAHEG